MLSNISGKDKTQLDIGIFIDIIIRQLLFGGWIWEGNQR